jgi:hypothetical protein
MLERVQNAIWIALFVFLVSEFGNQVWRASQHPPQGPKINVQHRAAERITGQQETNKTPPGLEDKRGKPENQDTRHDTSDVNIFGIKLGGLLLFAATVALWYATQSLVREAKRSSERQLRAYVAVKSRNAVNVYCLKRPSADFIIENTGQTPAYNVRFIARFEILPHPLPDNQVDLVKVKPEERKPNLTVHAYQKTIGDIDGSEIISMENWSAMCGDGHRLYLAGIVIYDDIFSRERRTKFCSFIGGPELNEIATRAYTERKPFIYMDWTFSHVHNEAT